MRLLEFYGPLRIFNMIHLWKTKKLIFKMEKFLIKVMKLL